MSDSVQTNDPADGRLTARALALPDVTPLDSFRRTATRLPGSPFLHYFGTTLTFSEADAISDAMAAGLLASGVRVGDRVGLFLQNDPDFAIAQLATWKVGGVCVSINPMLRAQELQHILVDSGATALVVLKNLWDDVASEIVAATVVRTVFLTNRTDWEAGSREVRIPRLVGGTRVQLLQSVIRAHSGAAVGPSAATIDDVALICYTSGTSGRQKGVAASHRNVAYSAAVYQSWMSIDEHDVFLCGAPIFHVTGLVAGLALSYRSGMSMVLFHRFDAAVCLEQIERHRPTFTIMATTAFQALLHHPDSATRSLRSLTKVYSGGAPVTSAIDRQWFELSGSGIRNVYGLTETTGPTHATPLAGLPRLDPESGAMAIGLPLPGVEARLVDVASGAVVPAGQQGELWVKGPMVMREYWNLPDATAEAFKDGFFRTGDIGKKDSDGWFYIIDRLKDMINASGYKVWPREVEDYLLQHPDILEVAVVGIPDSYRGESVKAFVVLRNGSILTPGEIIAFAKMHMAAYKYPRCVEVVGDLPKTASGKVLRRELRTR